MLSLLALLPSRPAAAFEITRIETLEIETAKGRFSFRAEIADTPELRERGLMFRHRLPETNAMLFRFDGVQEVAMWMRNTYIPLDMIFIAASGRVVNVAIDTEPFSEEIIRSEGPVAGVLEVAAGTAARIGLKPGDEVLHPMFGSSP